MTFPTTDGRPGKKDVLATQDALVCFGANSGSVEGEFLNMAPRSNSPEPDGEISLHLRFIGANGEGDFSSEAGTLPLALGLSLQNDSPKKHRIRMSSPRRHKEQMHLTLTPKMGGEALSFTVANKFFKVNKNDSFSMGPAQEVTVHVDQFKKVESDGGPSYFLMWGVSQIFHDIERGSYLAKASLTIVDGTWTGTLHSNQVLVDLP